MLGSEMLCGLHARAEAAARCRLDVSVLKGLEDDADGDPYDALYPINALRNAALGYARTERVLVLDVDFVPSSGLADALVRPVCRGWTCDPCNDKVAIVVPAFEMAEGGSDGGGDDDGDGGVGGGGGLRFMSAVPTDAATLKRMCARGEARPFHVTTFPKGHGPTRSARWLSGIDSVPFDIDYQPHYEPYVVCEREKVPRCVAWAHISTYLLQVTSDSFFFNLCNSTTHA